MTTSYPSCFSSSMKYHFTARRSPAAPPLFLSRNSHTPSLFLSLLSLSPSLSFLFLLRSTNGSNAPVSRNSRSANVDPTSESTSRPASFQDEKRVSENTHVPPSRRRPLLAGVNVGYALPTRGGSVHANLARRSRDRDTLRRRRCRGRDDRGESVTSLHHRLLLSIRKISSTDDVQTL